MASTFGPNNMLATIDGEPSVSDTAHSTRIGNYPRESSERRFRQNTELAATDRQHDEHEDKGGISSTSFQFGIETGGHPLADGTAERAASSVSPVNQDEHLDYIETRTPFRRTTREPAPDVELVNLKNAGELPSSESSDRPFGKAMSSRKRRQVIPDPSQPIKTVQAQQAGKIIPRMWKRIRSIATGRKRGNSDPHGIDESAGTATVEQTGTSATIAAQMASQGLGDEALPDTVVATPAAQGPAPNQAAFNKQTLNASVPPTRRVSNFRQPTKAPDIEYPLNSEPSGKAFDEKPAVQQQGFIPSASSLSFPVRSKDKSSREEPTVHVSIGRIEIRAVSPPTSPKREKPVSQGIPLREYLQRRAKHAGGG
jgi:hypothetical protein